MQLERIGVRVVSVPAAAAEHAQAALGSDADVTFAERDGVALPQETIPDDPYFPQGAYAIGGGAWGWYRSHTTQAWDVTMGDAGVTVAVLDTGLKPQGLDFDGQLVAGYNVLNGSTDTSSGAGNHGTHVAGVVGLAANTASGNAGYCPGCRIMPVQVGTDAGATYSDISTGIIWAADHGARVENLSWAGTTASSTLSSAVAYARSKGVVVFAAAGNSNCDCPTYPSATPGVLGVGGVGNSGAKAGDSNYGSWVAVAAPEGNMSAWPTINGSPGYGQVGGTSLAAPAAAAVAGLLFSAKPTITGAEVEQALTSSAAGASFSVRYGEIDATAALASLGITAAQPPATPLNTIAPRLLLQTNGDQNNTPLTRTPQVGDVLVRGQGAWRGAYPLSLTSVRWQRCQQDGSGCVAVGSAYRYTVQSADTGLTLRLTVTFTTPAGSTSASSALSSSVGGAVAPPTVQAPAATAPPAISGTAQAGQTLTASSGSWSGSPTSYAYAWQRCDGAGANCAAISGAAAQTYVVGAADVGTAMRVAVTASNSGGSATAASDATSQVAAAPAPATSQTLTLSGSLSAKTASRSFTVALGAGPARARLSFSKCSSLTLTLGRAGGVAPLASATGPSVLTLDWTASAGGYVYTVSGSGRCSFTLTVNSASP